MHRGDYLEAPAAARNISGCERSARLALGTSNEIQHSAQALISVGITTLTVTIIGGPATAGVESRVIDTHKEWNGTDYVYLFGHPDTATYGQTVLIPAGLHHVRELKFWMAPNAGD